jgi:hypothetical protein
MSSSIVHVGEWLVIGLVISLQIYQFIRTKNLISAYRDLIPRSDSFRVKSINVPELQSNGMDATALHVDLFYANKNEATDSFRSEEQMHDLSTELAIPAKQVSSEGGSAQTTAVTILGIDVENNRFEKILDAVNKYLIRNRKSAADFNLVRDIVERHAGEIEENINLTIATPLYLGLLGTMFGIVFGLYTLDDSVGQTADITSLIDGVKIAMIASMVGLALTILNSSVLYRNAKSKHQRRKSEMYTFIQIELLPLIGQSLASTLESLQRNMHKFNGDLSGNLAKLEGVFNTNVLAIKAQKELLDAVDKAKVSEMTKYNIKVMQQLDTSVHHFDRFNGYLSNVTAFVESSRLLADRLNEILDKTSEIESLAGSFQLQMEQNQGLMTFISGHLEELENIRSYTNSSVAKVGHSVTDAFSELREHIQDSTLSLKRFTVEEIELLRQAMTQSKTNLSNLEYLGVLKNDVSHIKSQSDEKNKRLFDTLDNTTSKLDATIEALRDIERHTIGFKAKEIVAGVNMIFPRLH